MRERANWMSLLLSAQTGTSVTPAQLLGTDKKEKAEEARAAQKALNKLLKRVRRRKPELGEAVYEEITDGADEVRRKRLTRG